MDNLPTSTTNALLGAAAFLLLMIFRINPQSRWQLRLSWKLLTALMGLGAYAFFNLTGKNPFDVDIAAYKAVTDRKIHYVLWAVGALVCVLTLRSLFLSGRKTLSPREWESRERWRIISTVLLLAAFAIAPLALKMFGAKPH